MTNNNDSFETSNLQIKLTLRGGGLEIATEGTISSISKELDALVNFARRVSETISPETPEENPESSEIENVPTAEIPSIVPSIKASKSTTSNIEALFNTSWGRTPRTLAEIMKALEVNAIPDRPEAVQSYLSRLLRKGSLRRINKEGKYVYFKLPE